MPFLTKASAVTAPTGPAPTTITRSACCIIRSRSSHYTHSSSDWLGVVPAQAGTHNHRSWNMGPRLRGNDSIRTEKSISDFRNFEHRRVEQLLGGDFSIHQAPPLGRLRPPRHP